MIVVDTSALMAVFLNEPDSDDMMNIILGSKRRYISVASVLEANIASLARNRSTADMEGLIENLGLIIHPVDTKQLSFLRLAIERFGKGRGSKAQLNFGDCFSYALATSLGVPLLFKGNDFAATDVESALIVAKS
jgi:ribonuclease VapC